MAKKYCYLFTEGNANMRELLGGKGANLAEMTHIGLPVPQGFTISTEACTQYYEDGRKINDEIMAEIMTYIGKMEEITGKKFGDKKNPLLVSVRSGARASMPGMMDTILNLGLNEEVVEVIAEQSKNPRWAWDCYRRFIQMYSDVVMEVGKKYFEQLIDKMKAEKGVHYDVELTADDLKTLANQFKAEYKSKIGADFPSDPKEQLVGAIKAVFRSWDNPRANVYRRDNDIPYSWGTAVNVQMMAFGNMTTAAPVLPSRVTLRPAKRNSWVSSSRTHRARTSLPVSARLSKSRRWQNSSRTLSSSSPKSAPFSRTTTTICRTWSSPLSTANSSCSRPVTVSARLRRL